METRTPWSLTLSVEHVAEYPVEAVNLCFPVLTSKPSTLDLTLDATFSTTNEL